MTNYEKLGGVKCDFHIPVGNHRDLQKPTLIRIERMKRVLDAGKRCNSEGLQLSFRMYRFVFLLVLSFWVTDLTRTYAGFLSGAPRLRFYFGGVVHKIFGLGN